MIEDRTFNGTGNLRQELVRDGAAREEIALRLTLEAMRQSERALVGLLALPASLALGLAATVSYAAAFVERGFQTFEDSLARLGRASVGELQAGGSQSTAMIPAAPGGIESGEKQSKTARS